MDASSTAYSSPEEAHDALCWVLGVKGDGTHGSVVQDVAKNAGGIGIGYYITVPVHMAKDAGYVIDWINQRITREAYEGYYLIVSACISDFQLKIYLVEED